MNAHCPGYTRKINLASLHVHREGVHLDVEVGGSFVKRGMGRNWYNPMQNEQKLNRIRALSTYISGSVMPFVALAQSRCVFTDMMIDSVPPEVVAPAPVGLLNIRRHIATISASIFRTAGKTSGWSGLETA